MQKNNSKGNWISDIFSLRKYWDKKKCTYCFHIYIDITGTGIGAIVCWFEDEIPLLVVRKWAGER